MTPPRLAPGSADALLFDLGRVVFDIDFKRAMACWARHGKCEPEEITARFSADEVVRQYEAGKVDDAVYFAHLRKMLGVDITDAQLLEGWNAIFVGEIPGIAPLLARAARHLPLYVLSNTNPPHIAHFSKTYADVLQTLAAGQVDGAFVGTEQAYYYQDKGQSFFRIALAGYDPHAEALAFKDQALAEKVAEVMNEMKVDGSFDKLFAPYHHCTLPGPYKITTGPIPAPQCANK